MRCAAVRKELNRYLDAELAPKAREEVERHLTACPACREALAQLQGVSGLWAALETPRMPEGFADRVMREARQRTGSRPRQAWHWPWLRWWWEQSLAMRAAAASTVVAGLAVGVIMGGGLFRPLPPAIGHDPLVQNLGFVGGIPAGSVEQTYLASVAEVRGE
ncbi:MAG: zf-HC2 domain-containing protein [Verrucomicrobia bacterium]|nr:zf-HC2 domain-containing protein [Verrucomicrobiota bacterium]